MPSSEPRTSARPVNSMRFDEAPAISVMSAPQLCAGGKPTMGPRAILRALTADAAGGVEGATAQQANPGQLRREEGQRERVIEVRPGVHHGRVEAGKAAHDK